MKTKEELNKLSQEIVSATFSYHNAIAENLKESGKEHKVIGDDEDFDGIYLKVRDDDSVDTILVDKVRWNEEREYIEYHCCEWNYTKTDDWCYIAWLGDDADYVFEAIEWEDYEKE